MNAPKGPAGAIGTAGTAGKAADRPESKQRRGFAPADRLRENCGKSAGRVRELREESEETSLQPSSAELQPLPMPMPARSLVRPRPLKAPREVQPAEAPAPPGAYAGPHTFAKRGRAWAVHDSAGELVALVLYRKGAAEVVRRLDSGTEATT